MEVNGIAHTQLSVNRFDDCVAFYDRSFPISGCAWFTARTRSRNREDIDQLYGFLQELGAEMVRPPEEGPGAPVTTRSRS